MSKNQACGSKLLMVFFLLAATLSFRAQAKSPRKPAHQANLLLITIDTLRADRLNCYGSSSLKTPNIDSLASRGVLFSRAFAHSVTTLPSHANILLGTTPPYHGVHDNTNFVVRDELTTLAEHLKQFGYSTAAFVGAFPLDARFGLSQGFDVYDDQYVSMTTEETAKERKAEVVVAKALEWLKRQEKEPWFLWIHCWDPHDPYDPPEPFKSQYAGRLYEGEVAYVDFTLGKVFGFLEDHSLFPRTMVILTGDHGESLGEHGEKTHGFLAYNPTLWIPLIIVTPGLKPGKVDENVSHIDLFPTVCDGLKIKTPTWLHGTSLLPALKGKPMSKRPIYFESLSPFYSFGWAPIRGYIEDEDKFIDSPIPEFYNLKEDFEERRNLVENKRVDELREKIAQIISRQSHLDSPKAEQRMDRETLNKLRSLGYVQSAQEKKKQSFGPEDDVKTLLPYYNRAAEALEISNQGRIEEAIRLLKEIITENPSIPHAYTNLALLYKDLGRIKDGLEVLKVAFQSMPDNYDIFSDIIAFLMEDSQDDAVIEGFKAFRFREMDYDPVIWNYAGLAYWHKGEKEEAQRCWERAIAIDPKFPTAYGNLGTLYHAMFRKTQDKKDYERSAENFKKAIELDPSNSPCYNSLGLLYLEAAAYIEAIAYLEKALKIDPNFFDALYNLGMAHMKTGAFSAALKYFQRFKASPAYQSLGPSEKEEVDKLIQTCKQNSSSKE
ncbi:MAG: sulfatase-like hydrolase/transferase [Candidatus Aminicenantales bacterium]